MSIEKAREYLKTYGLDTQIMEFPVSSATVAEAAKALSCEEKEIAKTLSFIVEGKPILIVAAGDAKIDNSKYKAEFHTKAKMIPFEEVEALIGHAVGGVCPFGVNKGVTIYLDESLKRFDTVYPACGSANSAIKLTVEMLENITDHQKWIDVCKYVS
ncbi:MAG: YbaK/EbsC family protein [Clostridia bacterium]|nr:YbaK/EbsC family protein [Clostridia bacterium]